jgi:hypothetical protein
MTYPTKYQTKFRLSIVLILITYAANAQKLPNVQTVTVPAPVNVKIDGKANDWNNQFQAYNKATDVSYTIANDKDKLYLVLQSTDEFIIKKMIWGRVIFSINKAAKKEDPNNIMISYPIIDRKDRPAINFKEMPKIIDGNPASVTAANEFMNLSNRRLAEKSKLIKVTGVKGLDTLISVYNADGIKAASAFDNKMAYTYELAIDMKMLGLSANSADKFYYNIMLNELPFDDIPGIAITRAANGEITSVTINKSQTNPGTDIFRHTTDFWCEYVLVK